MEFAQRVLLSLPPSHFNPLGQYLSCFFLPALVKQVYLDYNRPRFCKPEGPRAISRLADSGCICTDARIVYATQPN